MCGVAGFIGFPENNDLADMANIVQHHRGPDFQGKWFDDHISLAHQRLSIIDLSSRSNQPLVKDGLVIVFNGEIYNYKDLQKELHVKNNVSFRTESDTEVVLEAYRKDGSDCLKKFIGMFAFAIYDIHKKTVFIARDHFGIKPLFYARSGQMFCFSSELKTLAGIQEIGGEINNRVLVSCLNYLWPPGDETMFKGIMKLSPGHYMTVDHELNIQIVKYTSDADTVKYCSEADAVEMLDKVIGESMSRHMVSDVPVCSFLSGGLDSSLISVMAAQHTDNLSTYTIATNPEDKKIEKMPEDEVYARKVAKQFGFNHNEIVIDSNIVRMLPEMVKTLDEPIGDPAAINTFLICNEAHKRGVKVLLSGMGADEIFFGYRRQKATLMAMRYRKYFPLIVRSLISRVVGRLPVRINGRGIRLIRWAKKFLSFADLPLSQSYMQSYSYYSKDELCELLNHKHKQEVDNLYTWHDAIFNERYQDDPINQMCNTDIQMFMVGLNLTYTDRASMASSVEVRVPFIDKEVVSAAMSLGGSLKYHKGESKYILKKVAEKYLPNDIIYRPKASFGAPIRSWISGELKGMVDDLLSEENISKRGLFNCGYIRKLVEEDRSGIADNAYRIYQLLTLELWFREYVDL